MDLQDDVSGVTRELAISLRRAISEARFDIRRFRTFSVAELQEVYTYGHPTDKFRIGTSRPVLDDTELLEIERVLRSMLAAYVEGDSVGNGFALIAGGLAMIPLPRLVEGVLRAAAIVGPEQTAYILDRWANGEPIQYQRCALLDGLSLDQPLVVNTGLHIDVLPNSSTEALRHLPVGAELDIAPSNVLGKVKVAITCSAGPAFFLPSQMAASTFARTTHGSSVFGPVKANFWDIFCKALSLAGDQYVGCMVEWTEPVEAEPFGLITGGVSGSRKVLDHHAVVSRSLSQAEMDHALAILHKLSGDTNPDNRPWLAIDRWMRSKETRRFADQIIDLRIALEALFGVDGGREIAFRVATRGAWYLGSDPKHRKRIYTSLEAAYREASKFIHADTGRANQKSQTVLGRAQTLCRDAILRWLDYPWKPDKDKWAAMIMGELEH